MTPEQRAQEAISRWRDCHQPGVVHIDLLDGIAAAIRAAVEQERERCARIAMENGTIRDYIPIGVLSTQANMIGADIASAIRAGRETT